MNTTSSPTYERLTAEKASIQEEIKKLKVDKQVYSNTIKNLEDQINGVGPKDINKEAGIFSLVLSIAVTAGGAAFVKDTPIIFIAGIVLLLFSIKEIINDRKALPPDKQLEVCKERYAKLDSQIDALNKRLKSMPTRGACHHYERNLEIAKLSGISKREKMQADWQTSCIEAQRALKLSIEAQAKTAGSMIGYKEQSNWAVMGGIASGIAGPVAGIANAMSIQAEERARAEQIRKGGERVVTSMVRDLENLQLVEKDLNRVNEVIARTASLSVISDISADEIKNHISCDLRIVNPDCQLLEISGTVVWTKQLPALRSHKKPVRIDGTLQVDVKKDNEIVSTAYIPFPLDGFPYDKNVSVIPVTGYSLLPQASLTGPFSISLNEKQNLWILEG